MSFQQVFPISQISLISVEKLHTELYTLTHNLVANVLRHHLPEETSNRNWVKKLHSLRKMLSKTVRVPSPAKIICEKPPKNSLVSSSSQWGYFS